MPNAIDGGITSRAPTKMKPSIHGVVASSVVASLNRHSTEAELGHMPHDGLHEGARHDEQTIASSRWRKRSRRAEESLSPFELIEAVRNPEGLLPVTPVQ